jgi:hypothetical protein
MKPMSHIPVNHHLRPLYRTLALLSGAYLIIFGVVALGKIGSGQDLWASEDLDRVFGQHTNRGYALLCIVIGAIVVFAAVVGRNLDRTVNMLVAVALFIIGTAMLGLLRYSNVLGGSVSTVIVAYIIGMVLFAAAMYGKTGSAEQAAAEESFRHGGH